MPVKAVFYFLVFAFWLVYFIPAFAQPTTIDSLLAQLRHVQDTSRVNVLNQLGFQYKGKDPDRLIAYSRQAAQLSEQLNFTKGLAYAYNHIGAGYSSKNNYSQALVWFDKALQLNRKMANTKGEQAVLVNVGIVYHKQNNYPKAIEYYLEGLKLAEKRGDEIRMANVLNYIGDIYTEQQDYKQALPYYTKSLALKKKHFIKGRPVSQALNNIGNLYLTQKNYKEALPYFLEALRGLTDQDKDQRVVCLANLGMVYGGAPDGGLGQYAKALQYLERALLLQKELGDPYDTPYLLQGLAHVYQKTGPLAKSETYAQQALSLAQKFKIKSLSAELYRLLSQLYAEQGRYQQAYTYHTYFVQSQDSIRNDENTRQLIRLQASYETQKKQAEIELLKKDRQQEVLRRNAIGGGLLALLLVAGLIVSRQRLKIRQDKLLVAKSKEVAEKNTLLESQAQMLAQQAQALEQQTQALEQQTVKLQELDQVKSNFFANISHEFRTPLTLILGTLSDKMARPLAASQELIPMSEKEVRVMHRNAKRLLELINQLLDLSKLESGQLSLQPQPGNLNQFFRVLAGSFSSVAEYRHIQFNFYLPEKAPYLRFDADKLEKIFSNLLSNAFKFSPDGGAILLQVELFPVLPERDWLVQVTVQDSGPGIATDQLDKVFDRFYQGSKQYSDQQGTGIGLALVKELVTLHGGKVWAENHDQGGARFIVRLPLLEVPEEEIKNYLLLKDTADALNLTSPVLPDRILPEPTTAEIPVMLVVEPAINALSVKPVLLLVEDNEDLRQYIRGHLEDQYTILESENGRLGLEKAISQVPDLIISDLMMPEMDGITLCHQIKTDERISHIPIILLTALATDQSKLQGLETGADEYLTKPFNPQELQIRVRNLVESRKKLRERFGKEIWVKPKDITVSSVDEKFLEKAIKVVEENMSDPDFGAEEFSREIGMSRMQLHRKLTALTGQSTSDFLRSMRLKRAAQLMQSRAGNVSEVAYEVGFNSLSYFSKCFKEQFQVQPNEYLAQTEKNTSA